MSDKIVFKLENVSYHYPSGEQALSDINLLINQGEKVVLLGANGCGKSTLLKLLDGLYFPQKGCISFWGQPVNEQSLGNQAFSFAFRRQVGFIFQNSEAQLFNSNVWEEIAFGPLQMGLSNAEIQQRVDSVITMLGLEQIKNRPLFKLSGGEKKKVALASVLSLNPDVILLDEPTNGLDPRTQSWLINLIKQLSLAGKTLITSTHNLDIVEEIADRVVVFSEDHRVVASGDPSEILSNRELLLRENLVDELFHHHGKDSGHCHYHTHG